MNAGGKDKGSEKGQDCLWLNVPFSHSVLLFVK